MKYAKYVLHYLKGTRELKIKYDGSSDAGLIGYSDSDWGENRDDHHSTSGHVFLMANRAISWASATSGITRLPSQPSSPSTLLPSLALPIFLTNYLTIIRPNSTMSQPVVPLMPMHGDCGSLQFDPEKLCKLHCFFEELKFQFT